ncbi:hypothetical protein AB9G23_08020, partial [Francisella philomiragia]
KERDVIEKKGFVEREGKQVAKKEAEIKQREQVIERMQKQLNKLKYDYGKTQLMGTGDSKPSSNKTTAKQKESYTSNSSDVISSKLKSLDSLYKKESQKSADQNSLKTLNMSGNQNTESFGLAELFGDSDKFGSTTKLMQEKKDSSLEKINMCKPSNRNEKPQVNEKISSSFNSLINSASIGSVKKY